MFVLSVITKNNIKKATGLYVDQIIEMDISNELNIVKSKTASILRFSKRRKYGIIGRGNPLLSRRKIRTIEDIIL